jgi:hypothetical protein
MKFVGTYRFSPVIFLEDLPLDGDLFHFEPNEIPDTIADKKKFYINNDIEIDEIWWNEQERRCIDGYYVENAVVKGGDAIVDGRDAIWNDTDEPMFHINPNFDKEVWISPHSVYLNDADIEFVNGTVYITGRQYFYLNFWKIMRKLDGKKVKGYGNPKFLDIDYLKFARIRMMEEQGKDSTEVKGRQLGYSETSGGGILGYNFTFIKDSENVIVAGNDEDMHNLFIKTQDGLSQLKNTQFYKETSTNSNTKHRMISKWFRSRILGFTANHNDQVLSRLSPTVVIFEEVGKWAKGLAPAVITYVMPSIFAEGERTGNMYFIGTGGDMEGGASDLEELHYKGNSEHFLRFKNKFEREKLSSDQYSGWFSSKAWFTSIDKDGNSNLAEGKKKVLHLISLEKDAVKKYLATTQNALYAEDAFMMSTAGYFGEHKINLLNAQLSRIRLHKELQIERHGILEWKDRNHPFKGVRFVETNKEEAFITIIEEPILDEKGEVYRGLYEIGIDSYDQDESQTSTSMGALVIRKKFLDYNTTSNIDIALLLERPETKHGGKNKFYEHCAMAGIWCGNVPMTIEHTKTLVIDWLESNGFENLLAFRPRFAFAGMINKSMAMNKYGVDGSMKPHVMAIKSEELTDEFISEMYIIEQIKALAKYKYSRTYNCDITVASAHAAVAAKENNKQVAYSVSKRKERSFKPTLYKREGDRILTI